MKINKYRKIIAKFLLTVVLLTISVVQWNIVYAEEDEEEQLPPYIYVEANINRGIIAERDIGDLHVQNTSLIKYVSTQGYADQCRFCCDVVNRGTTSFKGLFDLNFYDASGSLMITMLGYVGEELLSGEIRTITASTNMDLMGAASMVMSIHSDSIGTDNTNISGSCTIDNILQMNDMHLFSNRFGTWTFEFSLKAINTIYYEIPRRFELYLTFIDEQGTPIYNKQMTIEGALGRETFYTDSDLSAAHSLDVSTNLPPYNSPGQTSIPTQTPTLTPSATAGVTAEPGPIQTPGGTESMPPVSTPWEVETFPPGVVPTASAVTSKPVQSTPAVVTAEPGPTGAGIESTEPMPTEPIPTAPIQTYGPKETDVPDVRPSPTRTPLIADNGGKKTKLQRPVISVKIKKIYKKMWMAKVRLKKYQGTDVQIYYRRGKGKFKKIKMRRHNIKKNKRVFKVGYKKKNKPIYLRVRTYKGKKGKRVYSRFSKISIPIKNEI